MKSSAPITSKYDAKVRDRIERHDIKRWYRRAAQSDGDDVELEQEEGR